MELESGSSGVSLVRATVVGGASVPGATVVGAWVVRGAVYGGSSVDHTGEEGTTRIKNRNIIF